MAEELVSDKLWEIMESLLPEESPKYEGGRPQIDDRADLTGISWEILPQEVGRSSGATYWTRPCEWQEAGVWEESHSGVPLDRPAEVGKIDLQRLSLDSASIKGTGQNPTDTAKTVSKHHVHEVEGVRKLIEPTLCNALYLPAYSPLNPIEEALSKVKTILRKIEARTRERAVEAMSASRRQSPSTMLVRCHQPWHWNLHAKEFV